MFERKPMVINVHAPVRTDYVTREIHEHRAPTDESVRLLKELEEKAEAKIIETIRIADTSFECVVHQFLEAMTMDTVLRAVFSLNGKKHKAEHRFQESIRDRMDHQKEFTALRDEVAKVIATEMICDAFRRKPETAP